MACLFTYFVNFLSFAYFPIVKLYLFLDIQQVKTPYVSVTVPAYPLWICNGLGIAMDVLFIPYHADIILFKLIISQTTSHFDIPI